MTSDEHIFVFTDGAARGNPGPAGWGAVIVTDDEVVELGDGEAEATNNQMELSAVIGALQFLEVQDEWDQPVTIYTDSSYVQKGATQWIHSWVRRGWKTASGNPVKNKPRWQDIHDLLKTFTITIERLPGHAGIPGNERADEIATKFADDEDIDLYHGARSGYPIDLVAPVAPEALSRARKKKHSNGKAFSYLSLVDGEVVRHDTWVECKERVNGVSDARFRKATSAAEEKKILESWGVTDTHVTDQ